MRTLLEAAGSVLGGGALTGMLAAAPVPGRKPGCLVIYRQGTALAYGKFVQGDRAQATRLQREQQTLGLLWRKVPYPIVGAIPRALGMARYGTEGRVALQSPARGGALMRYMQANGKRLERTLELGLGWLARFHRWQHGLDGEDHAGVATAPEQVTPLLGALARAGVRIPGSVVRRVSECWEQLGTGAPQHGDFWPGNVFWAGGSRLWVLDWEAYGRTQQPLYDVLHYCTSAGLACLGMRWGSGDVTPFLRLYYEPSPIADLVAMNIRRVADMIGVTGPFNPHLVCYLCHRAARALEFAREDGAVPDLAEWVAMLEAAANREELVVDGKRTV